jgi:hypothetical protein
MSRHGEFSECRSVKDLQERFFLSVLPRTQEGKYWYREAGLKAKPGTIVLFQSDGEIIATAALTEAERFAEPDEGYTGVLHFDVSSIRVFDPIAWGTVSRIWPNVKRLGRVKWKLDPSGYAAFERELKHVEAPERVSRRVQRTARFRLGPLSDAFGPPPLTRSVAAGGNHTSNI